VWKLVRLETMIIKHTTQNLNSSSVAYTNSRSSLGKNQKVKSKSYDTDSVSFKGGVKPNTSLFNRFLSSEGFGKLLELAGNNPVVTSSLYALFLCVLLRPATIMALPGKGEDAKEDKKYASAHSIASGIVGFVTTLAIMTPIAAMTGKVFKNPAKYIKPDLIEKVYPHANVEATTNAAGKVIKKLKFTADGSGKMLQNAKYEKLRLAEIEDLKKSGLYQKLEAAGNSFATDGSVCTSLEPLMLKNAEGKMEVVRSSRVFKINSKGEKVGCALQVNGTPITEEMELGAQKFENINKLVNMGPDLLIAQPRAKITISAIPAILNGVLGVKKGGSKKAPEPDKQVEPSFKQANVYSNPMFNTTDNGKIPDYSSLFPGLRKESV